MVGQMSKTKKIKIKRIKLNKLIRLPIIFTLLVFLILFSYTTYAAYQKPIKTYQSYDILSYNHISNYNYDVFLSNNILYNKTQLKPNEGIIFKKLLNNINASFNYEFTISQDATINCSYAITAIIETDIWTKEYTLISPNYINVTGSKSEFTVDFPIEYEFYDQILNQINDETGIFAPNPQLKIITKITVTTSKVDNPIFSMYSPFITLSLGNKAIEVSDTLKDFQSESIRDTLVIEHPEVIEQRNSNQIVALCFFILLGCFILVTKDNKPKINPLHKEINSIKKKYAEWLVETNTNPLNNDMKIIPVNSIKQLSLISEEIGQPLLYYFSKEEDEENHWFYVLNNQMAFEYKPYSKSKIKKLSKINCPHCNTVYDLINEDITDQNTIKCPCCGNISTFYKSEWKEGFLKFIHQLKRA